MALQGNLEDFELTDVFQLIQLGQKDGGLRIQSETDVGIVYFKNGIVVHARTNTFSGESAIDIILGWKKGRFVFNPNEETLERTVDLPIQQVILEAARRIDEMNKIQKLIPSFEVVVQIVEVPEAGVEKIHLKPEEWKVLSFVDGSLTIRKIAAKANLSEFETARILYGMISSGLVTIATQAPPAKKEELPSTPPATTPPANDDDKKEGGGLFGFLRKK
ncbi:hypothetical protein A2Y85_01075 [candidate division WOR-3 bacterium RBG_13_43_14]|uniref:PatA-like N-terminal domain-containing protein n=1 Tax=candidate division WOR-3 bacterium RBG_13_43_14 TaxID=1802590 RepID=A0A1F4UAM1_UNCW3|nr:MAG: hypothetical protein A2Y85_01075 [candidate division WOR-3 bacterium RBG_13_43_14]